MRIDDYLVAWGVIPQGNETSKIVAQLQGELGNIPTDVGGYLRELYEEGIERRSQSSGTLFEYLIVSTFKKLGLTPFAYKAQLKPIPGIVWDIVFWNPKTSQPLVLFLTSSIRERYQLADAQAFRLKHSYPGAQMYLVSMGQKEVAVLSDKPFESLDGILFPDSKEFEQLVAKLQAIPRSQLSNDAIHGVIHNGRFIY